MPRRHLLPCVALTLACLASHCLAEPSPAATDPASLLRSSGYSVSYEDDAGHALTEDEFAKRRAASKSFTVTKDATRKTAIFRLGTGAGGSTPQLAVKPGDAVPSLSGKTLDGETLTLAAGDGRYTLVAFFFATCAPCVAEIPELNELSARHTDVRVLGVTFDPPATTQKLAAKHGIRYTTLSDAKASIDKLGIKAYPTLMLVKPDGTLAAVQSGGTSIASADSQNRYGVEKWLTANMAAGDRRP